MNKILSGLKPEIVWEIFEEITRVPRCSGKEEKLQGFVETWAKTYNIDFKKDATGNILLTRKAERGNENIPTLMLQAHQDMVCEKKPEISHDFNSDPIPLKVDFDKVSSNGTSLGADNGIGMALAMALLIDPTLSKHGKIEVILTVGEEVGFTGVRNMKPGFFSGKRMLNLDSEDVGVITISSAGGGGTEYVVPYKKERSDSWEALKIEVTGLLGGHSGVDIQLPRFNAIILLAQGLRKLSELMQIKLAHLEGGTRSNAIPRSAYAEVLIPMGKSGSAIECIKNWDSSLSRSEEKGLIINTTQSLLKDAVSNEVSMKIINLISEIPQGVFSWSKVYENLVQTSNNLGVVKSEEDKIRIPVSTRTSNLEDYQKNQGVLKALGEKYEVDYTQRAGSSGWNAKPDSSFLKMVEACYNEVYGKKTKLTGVHGGLECGAFIQLDLELEIVSIGPSIKYPHSPSEYLEINSVNILWQVVRKIAEFE